MLAAPTNRVLGDEEAILTEDEQTELLALIDEIGWHDTERIAFVRAHPDTFSI